MKQLHFTGRSYWEKEKLYTEIVPDFGYKLLVKNAVNTHKFVTVSILMLMSDSYEEQNKKLFTDFVVVRNYRQAGDTEVQLMNEKELNDWLKKHKYDKIES